MAKKRLGSKHRKSEPKKNREREAKKPRTPRKKIQIKLDNRQKKIAAVVIALLVLFMATYGRKIIKLQIENRSLRNQQEELNKEKSKLTKELKNIHSEDYIKDQARKKLRLLNEDERIFVFKGEDEDEDK